MLTAREYALLEHLVLHAGEVVGRADIAEHVWDASYEAQSNVIDVCIQRLRRKIDRPGHPSSIVTRRGEGYMLLADPAPSPGRLMASIRARLTLWYTGVLVVVLVVAAIAVAVVQERLALQRLDDDLRRSLLTLEGVMRTEFDENLDLPAAAAEARAEVVVPDRTLFIAGEDGTVVAAWGPPVESTWKPPLEGAGRPARHGDGWIASAASPGAPGLSSPTSIHRGRGGIADAIGDTA